MSKRTDVQQCIVLFTFVPVLTIAIIFTHVCPATLKTFYCWRIIYRVAQKVSRKLLSISSPNVFSKFLTSTFRGSGHFVIKWLLHYLYHRTLTASLHYVVKY